MVTQLKQSKYIENPWDCPVTRAMNFIGGKWKPIILFCIGKSSIRFGKLRQFIPAISNKVLTQELKELERNGFIERLEFRESPPRVEYILTKNGKSLLPILNQIAKWGESKTARDCDTLIKKGHTIKV